MKFTVTPQAKACVQVGAPLVVAAAGLTLAAMAGYHAARSPDAGGARDMADAAEAGYAGGAGTRAPVAIGERLSGPTGSMPAEAHDLDCLSEAVYFEARGESSAGQAAVAQVVLNRARHPAYPKSVCAVVFQAAGNGGCQFSFVCDGAMARPLEPVAWRRARIVASHALQGYVMTAVGRALNFHAADGAPGVRTGAPVARLGGHVFFTAAARPAPARDAEVRRAGPVEPPSNPDPAAPHEAPRAVAVALGGYGPFGKSDPRLADGARP